jgi:hypothetical protein
MSDLPKIPECCRPFIHPEDADPVTGDGGSGDMARMRWVLSRSHAEIADILTDIGDEFWPVGSQANRLLREAARRLRRSKAKVLPESAFLPR